MSTPCDDKYTFTAKPTTPTYTIGVKPTATYTITEEPCACVLCILTEDSYEILEEDGRGLIVEGTL